MELLTGKPQEKDWIDLLSTCSELHDNFTTKTQRSQRSLVTTQPKISHHEIHEIHEK